MGFGDTRKSFIARMHSLLGGSKVSIGKVAKTRNNVHVFIETAVHLSQDDFDLGEGVCN